MKILSDTKRENNNNTAADDDDDDIKHTQQYTQQTINSPCEVVCVIYRNYKWGSRKEKAKTDMEMLLEG